jgi:hypothetical protein
MKIINDTEVFDPGECYFSLQEGNGGYEPTVVISITNIDFWNEEHCLNDCFGDQSLTDETNAAMSAVGVFQEMEATWGSDKSIDDTRNDMLKLGFIESKKMGEELEATANGQ